MVLKFLKDTKQIRIKNFNSKACLINTVRAPRNFPSFEESKATTVPCSHLGSRCSQLSLSGGIKQKATWLEASTGQGNLVLG